MSELLYHLRGVTQCYRDRTVLKVDDLGIHPGEVLALLGPSGAGKSTLLRLLNFLELPSAGEISFRGQVISGVSPAPLEMRRRVTTVFQRPVLLNRSVWDNVRYGLTLRGERNGQAEVAGALEQVGLTSFARQQARTLSGGEAQRVALARALVLRPDVLLLDEPTANLDPYNVSLIEQIIQRANREQGATVVMVTHNLHQARRLGTRVGLLLDGAVVEVAPTDQFFELARRSAYRTFHPRRDGLLKFTRSKGTPKMRCKRFLTMALVLVVLLAGCVAPPLQAPAEPPASALASSEAPATEDVCRFARDIADFGDHHQHPGLRPAGRHPARLRGCQRRQR